MRDVILYMSMSLDGFVGSEREHPGMAVPEGAALKQWKLDRISKAGAHLMGRVTYQEMSSYWSRSDDPYAPPMNDIPKVVFSKTLSDAEATWPETRVAWGDLTSEIAAIKAEPGPDVIVWAGSRLHPPSNGARPHHDRPLCGSGAALLHDIRGVRSPRLRAVVA
jgi:dihydrofolate reductase